MSSRASDDDSAFYEPVGELQSQARDQALEHQKRGLDLAIPKPVKAPDQALFHANGTDTDGIGHTQIQTGSKRRQSSDGNQRRPKAPRQDSSGTIDDSDIDSDQSLSAEEIEDQLEEARADGEKTTTAGDALNRSENAPKTDSRAVSRTEEKVEELRILAERQNAPLVLPARKVFPIQIGSELFRLSGVSLSSDAPSYFTEFFEQQIKAGISVDNVRTLYIDRDPETFRDISLHLQGYHIEPRDGTHFVRLFADAILFSLPRLTQQLYKSNIFIRVGDHEFKVPRDLFSNPGDSPNYFTLGFSIFFTHPNNVFPGLSQSALLRPPAILPPQVSNRSARVFQDILDMLKGYEVHIRDADHRAELLRDARYFHFKGLEQKLIPHRIDHNTHRARQEITLRFEDLRPAGISYRALRKTTSSQQKEQSKDDLEGVISYSRPHVDDHPYDLNIEIGPDTIGLTCSIEDHNNHIVPLGTNRSKFHQLYKAICHKIEGDLPDKTKLEMAQSGVIATIDNTASVKIDGRILDWRNVEDGHNDLTQLWIASVTEPPDDDEMQQRTKEEWTVLRSIWRVQVRVLKGEKLRLSVVWCAVKIDAASNEAFANDRRGWL